ncbi:MAG: fructose PTS transporter subunit IIA, partial [Endozoicomonas sp.]
STVSVIDGRRNTVAATVATGANPWTAAVNPVTNRVYVANYDDDNVTVIDGATNAVTTLAAGDRPVIFRTVDFGADKPPAFMPFTEERNPFLGDRAVRLYPRFEEGIKKQLSAILQAASAGTVKLLVPMVSTVDEVLWVRRKIEEVQGELEREEKQAGSVEFGVMIEVPSCVFIIDQLSSYVDFFSIGTNDLTQYFVAADRGNERVSALYSHLHPSFIRMLNQLVAEAHKNNRWIGICGDMAADVRVLPLLLGLGVDEVSVPVIQIPKIKERIGRLDSSACQKLLEQVMACENIREVDRSLTEFRFDARVRPTFDESIILMDLDALTKEEVIKAIVDALDLDGRIMDCRSIEDTIWERERMYSTGLGAGIAIPHCKSDSVTCDSIGIARLTNPIDWQAVDEKPVDTVFLLAVKKPGVSEAIGNDDPMKIFARLARRLLDETFVQRLRECLNTGELIRLLEQGLDQMVFDDEK